MPTSSEACLRYPKFANAMQTKQRKKKRIEKHNDASKPHKRAMQRESKLKRSRCYTDIYIYIHELYYILQTARLICKDLIERGLTCGEFGRRRARV